MNPLNASRRELDSVVVNIELTLVSIIQGVALFFLTDNAPRHSVIATLGCVPLCRRRFVGDFYFLVTIRHSHAHPDQVATGIRAQFLLHRLRLGRSDLVQQARSPFGVVQGQRYVCGRCLAAFHLRYAIDSCRRQ